MCVYTSWGRVSCNVGGVKCLASCLVFTGLVETVVVCREDFTLVSKGRGSFETYVSSVGLKVFCGLKCAMSLRDDPFKQPEIIYLKVSGQVLWVVLY